MLQARARWKISEADARLVEELSNELHITPLVARLLVVRGITDKEHAAAFLFGGTDLVHDPFLLDGMDQAVARIQEALRQEHKIRVYGDYDADGVSSTTLMVHLLRQLNANFDYYIPHRVHEGYGLNKPAMDMAHQQGVQLIITVDTGISAVDEIQYAHDLGIDVIVTDHHEPPERLPAALAIINPKKPGCPYPFKQLAGVGVALKLAQALLQRWPEELLEFAAIGTVADLMPLLDENRVIVRQGIERMKSTSNKGIRALLDVAGIAVKDVNATHIGFALAPRINASGRLDDADAAVRLLISEDHAAAEQMANDLDMLNKERQRIVEEMTKEAAALLEERIEQLGELPKVIVLAQEQWNVGVIGIVASKLVDKVYRPTIILGIDKESGMAKGSARSIAGFDMYQALTHCQDLMDHYGGHQAAAGMTLDAGHLPELERRLNLLAEEWLRPEDYSPLIQADVVSKLEEVGIETIRQLEQLSPFGMGNPTPRFVIPSVRYQELRMIGKEQQHVKMTLVQPEAETSAALDSIGFNKGAIVPWISSTAEIDVLGELSVNEWNGVRKPQMILQDVRIPHIQLFDWRGASNIEGKLKELTERLRLLGRGGEAPMVPHLVVFHAKEIRTHQQLMDSYPIWELDPVLEDRFIPLNKLAESAPWTNGTDLVLYDLPPTLAALKQAVEQASQVQRWYALFGSHSGGNESSLPSRDMFKKVYGAVQQQGGRTLAKATLVDAISRRSGLSASLVQFMLDVFIELGFIQQTSAGITAIPQPAKKDLAASRQYQKRQQNMEVEQVLLYSSAQQLHEWLIRAADPNTHLKLLEGIV
ncbi:single-stranded-DNA-specific exonuclease RecJ [Paenibacillus rigui]|uniref:Single-stranded-DNA-specific exonuclease RecJ n=1 Tax=Paenibacillus rigui TaxID=554312 RepID=A0A229UTR9_9BACL|nr:single-stranded-DNA-specific exonuclease RecJ [Paenibacillus rigui]OXM86818.1 single-stranded-DNA-specific exonuclease RecJ [Paenibacillus rigui]